MADGYFFDVELAALRHAGANDVAVVLEGAEAVFLSPQLAHDHRQGIGWHTATGVSDRSHIHRRNGTVTQLIACDEIKFGI